MNSSNENRILFQCLMARDDEPFKIFSRLEWPCMQDKPVGPEERVDEENPGEPSE